MSIHPEWLDELIDLNRDQLMAKTVEYEAHAVVLEAQSRMVEDQLRDQS